MLLGILHSTVLDFLSYFFPTVFLVMREIIVAKVIVKIYTHRIKIFYKQE